MDGLEESITVFVLVPRHQRFLDELIEYVQDVGPRERRVGANGFGGLQCPSGREYGEASEKRLLGSLEKIVAPIDECLESLLAGHRGPIARCEQVESIVETRSDFFQRHRADARSRKLKREGDSVETGADPGDGRRIVRVTAKSGCRARERSTNSRTASARRTAPRSAPGSGRDSGGSVTVCSPAVRNGSRLVATISNTRTRAKQRIREARAGGQHMLAIVEQDQHALRLEMQADRFDEGVPATSTRPTTRASALTTSDASSIAVRSTYQTPSG